ncbi:Activator of Hsp90 ATPase 1 family protein [Cellulomonas flavigena DSM 20109]|uniref:Activator of Hsp90 ATPase 1 family protein n=1 Tax=Cellulomonas flavigena (strain ATCC 482 / DSM 20109 / BCRC 11376 / JCM 18109 / NBRC 3775 / NCIMB 8073 / NRS 134) TaxID=446466 RepID=D5UK32_CELFN|nr:SRPBCC domain-containing protein [Cellulomonas flavigena]ADG73774.1 Activator of Hsp90 ATPase 1 family protein [Cellulomonas flavigena DSM 20109]
MSTVAAPRSVVHSTFVVERAFDVPVARVWQAFADPVQKHEWFGTSDAWDTLEDTDDFRVGGTAVSEGEFHGGPLSRYVATYTDIVDEQRVVLTYDMWLDGVHISTSVATYELTADGPDRTSLRYTEQGTHLDGLDDPAGREQGMRGIFDTLAAYLAG